MTSRYLGLLLLMSGGAVMGMQGGEPEIDRAVRESESEVRKLETEEKLLVDGKKLLIDLCTDVERCAMVTSPHTGGKYCVYHNIGSDGKQCPSRNGETCEQWSRESREDIDELLKRLESPGVSSSTKKLFEDDVSPLFDKKSAKDISYYPISINTYKPKVVVARKKINDYMESITKKLEEERAKLPGLQFLQKSEMLQRIVEAPIARLTTQLQSVQQNGAQSSTQSNADLLTRIEKLEIQLQNSYEAALKAEREKHAQELKSRDEKARKISAEFREKMLQDHRERQSTLNANLETAFVKLQKQTRSRKSLCRIASCMAIAVSSGFLAGTRFSTPSSIHPSFPFMNESLPIREELCIRSYHWDSSPHFKENCQSLLPEKAISQESTPSPVTNSDL